MNDRVRVAALQMRSGVAPEANLIALETLASEAVRQGAKYVLSPEVTVAFAENREGLARVARPFENNQEVGLLSRMARKYGITLHLGSMAVALEDGRFANRSVVFGPDGAINATYDKIHLFDATLVGLRDYRESATYRGGDVAVVAPVTGFRLGMSICYDVRFPALYNALANGGAQVLAVPAAFTVPTGEAHWETLLRARAIETGSFVIAAAQGGVHENGRATYGHSMIIDPWGRVIARIEGDEPGVLVADLDLELVTEARRRVPALDNARPFSISVNQQGPEQAAHRDRRQ
jgi:predicted amidohydrolase